VSSRRARWLAAAALAAGAAPGLAGQAAVSLRPERLAVGETAELTFTINHSQLRGLRMEPKFELENFDIVGGPARRDNMTWVNGQLSRSLSLSWYLAPQRPGAAKVRSVRLLVGEQELAMSDQEAWVEDRPAASATPPADPLGRLLRDLMPQSSWQPRQGLGEPAILLRAELTAERPWAGQQLLYTLYLLAERRREGEGRVAIETIFPRRVPQFQGFWSQDVPLPESARSELVEHDGKLFWRQAILQRALFPYEPGTRTIESAEADLRLVYFRPIGFGLGEEPVRPAAVRRTSNSIDVPVQALPAAPAGFSGAVGTFRARARLEPSEIAAGEAATFTVELAGSGNVSGLPDPHLPAQEGLTVSAPQDASAQQVEGRRVESSRSWSWVVVPDRAGSWQLPPVEWITFDPVAGSYEKVATQAQQIAATPAPPAPAPTPATVEEVAPRPAWQRVGVPALAGAAVAALAVAGFFAFRRIRRGDRRARRRLLEQLVPLREAPGPARQVASVAEEAWREFLGRRFAVPAEVPPNQWPRFLAARGLEPHVTSELLRLLDDLHYLRYAPQLASTDSLQRDLWDRSRRLARRLA
jgi:hypothetical protein